MPMVLTPALWDAFDPAQVAGAARGMDVIVNALNPPYPRWTRDLPRLTGSVIAAARESGATVMIPGNVYNYGAAMPRLRCRPLPRGMITTCWSWPMNWAILANMSCITPGVRAPVAGTQGLTPGGWHHVVEQWGAAQLQKRFRKLAKRPMTNVDYAAWLAVVSLGRPCCAAMSRPR